MVSETIRILRNVVCSGEKPAFCLVIDGCRLLKICGPQVPWRSKKGIVKNCLIWDSTSHPGEQTHKVLVWENGEVTCDCLGWINSLRFHKERVCRHVRATRKLME